MSTLKVNRIEPANAGSEDYVQNRVYCVTNSSLSSILNSHNISSVTDVGVGDADFNLTNAFSDANFTRWAACNASSNLVAGISTTTGGPSVIGIGWRTSTGATYTDPTAGGIMGAMGDLA
jgi:hypothetical protein